MEHQDLIKSSNKGQLEMDTKENLPSFSQLSAKVRAMVRIQQKYQALKRRRMEMSSSLSFTSSRNTSPKIFTFDDKSPSSIDYTQALMKKRKDRKRTRILYPNGVRKITPNKEHSRAKNCLYLLCIIVFLQVYNAIENLDDHVLRYDLEGLEKTLKREVFGQKEVMENLLAHLKDYLSTYVHSKPLVLSLHGATGVGKSLLGRVLAQHFRSVVGETLVLQFFVLHHCPLDGNISRCSQSLSSQVSDIVLQAEEEEKIPIFIFDEVEHMPKELLDLIYNLIHSQHTNEYLNVIYILISNLGHEDITKFVLHNSSSSDTADRTHLPRELSPMLQTYLRTHHPVWKDTEILPLTLLEKTHVIECFVDEMSREGFYPDLPHIEQLASEIPYYYVRGREYSRTGCKQVVAKVNLL
ncbi:torsin-4A [Denticeps clupeoides]|uniref:Torsin-1A C-terminal domain-containing protein n=1 Tax=Denticeps clupeoides TaxID=299321 RepID=A0AAY4EA51_9TELE|nr:torsin-4A-like [Denticeps clupeoides]